LLFDYRLGSYVKLEISVCMPPCISLLDGFIPPLIIKIHLQPGHIRGDLVLKLMAIRVLGFLRFGFVFRQKPEMNSLLLYLLDVMTVN
jgi:hypothetical protein